MKPRPDVIKGKTYWMDTGYGRLTVILNTDEDGTLFECFVDVGKSGGFTSSFTEAVGRLISLCLRSGIEPKVIIKQLLGIRSPRIGIWRGVPVLSIPDGIARAMMVHLALTDKDIQPVAEDPSLDGRESVVLVEDDEDRVHSG